MNCIGLYISDDKNIIVNCNDSLQAISKDEYINKDIKPKFEELTTKNEYEKKNKNEVSPILIALQDFKKEKLLEKKTLDALQHAGLIFPDNNGIRRITPSGESSLKQNGLV